MQRDGTLTKFRKWFLGLGDRYSRKRNAFMGRLEYEFVEIDSWLYWVEHHSKHDIKHWWYDLPRYRSIRFLLWNWRQVKKLVNLIRSIFTIETVILMTLLYGLFTFINLKSKEQGIPVTEMIIRMVTVNTSVDEEKEEKVWDIKPMEIKEVKSTVDDTVGNLSSSQNVILKDRVDINETLKTTVINSTKDINKTIEAVEKPVEVIHLTPVIPVVKEIKEVKKVKEAKVIKKRHVKKRHVKRRPIKRGHKYHPKSPQSKKLKDDISEASKRNIHKIFERFRAGNDKFGSSQLVAYI